MDYHNGLMPLSQHCELSCPSCGADSVETVEIEHPFTYGDGDRAVALKAVIPVRRYMKCCYEFLDAEAEERQHDAVCRHLGVMTSSEVRAIRQQCGGLSRAEFARVTRLGEATIGRWERGELIQNAANDQYLHLLRYPENVERLR
jgi:DNA-binding transcriptional regulator YiaG